MNVTYRKIMPVLLLIAALLSCTSRHAGNRGQQDIVDSILISRFDSLYTYPAEMQKCFQAAQQGLTDSTAYYKLELFVGYCLYLQGYTDKNLQINDRVLDYCHHHSGTDALEADCWNHRFAMLQGMNQRDSAIACLHHAYDILTHATDRRELENVCINLADQYRQKGELAEASKFYHRALWVVDSLNSQRVRFSIYVGLAQVYADLHNFSQAHYYFGLAERDQEQRLAYDNYHFWNAKGNCYYFEEKYSEALSCFRKAYKIAQSFKQPSLDALVEANIGEIFTLLGRYDSAHHYLDKSYAYFKNDPTANEEVIFYLNSLQAALALRKNETNIANTYLSQPYNPLHIGPSYTYLHNKRFMEYYAQKGDYAKAYRYRLAVEQYDDSMRNVRYVNNITEIDYRYKQDTTLLKRNIQIAQNKAQLSHQHNTIVLTVSLLLILLLLGILAFFYIRRKNEREYSRQMSLITHLRMENVKNRISPHYMFNVLNTLMPIFKQYEDLSRLLQLFIKVLRGNLSASDQVAVQLQEEVELVKSYITLRKETNPQTVNVTWEIDDDVPRQTLIPSMCIQIPIENALKYAFDSENNGANQLSIQITTHEGGIQIYIQDNGCGYDPGRQTDSARGTGNGLKMLFRTVEVLNGRNIQKMTFSIQNLAQSEPSRQGTLVSIFVPYNYQFNF